VNAVGGRDRAAAEQWFYTTVLAIMSNLRLESDH